MIFTDSMPATNKYINPTDVLSALKDGRENLVEELRNSDVPIYPSCKDHPGLIEQRMPDGIVRVGKFANGEFVPKDTGRRT